MMKELGKEASCLIGMDGLYSHSVSCLCSFHIKDWLPSNDYQEVSGQFKNQRAPWLHLEGHFSYPKGLESIPKQIARSSPNFFMIGQNAPDGNHHCPWQIIVIRLPMDHLKPSTLESEPPSIPVQRPSWVNSRREYAARFPPCWINQTTPLMADLFSLIKSERLSLYFCFSSCLMLRSAFSTICFCIRPFDQGFPAWSKVVSCNSLTTYSFWIVMASSRASHFLQFLTYISKSAKFSSNLFSFWHVLPLLLIIIFMMREQWVPFCYFQQRTMTWSPFLTMHSHAQ